MKEFSEERIEYVAQAMRQAWALRNGTISYWEDLNAPAQDAYRADAEAALRADAIWPRVQEERAFHEANPGTIDLVKEKFCFHRMTPLYGDVAVCDRRKGHKGPHRQKDRPNLRWSAKTYWYKASGK